MMGKRGIYRGVNRAMRILATDECLRCVVPVPEMPHRMY